MAFCSKCGAMLAEGANFCSNCGATVQTAPLAAQPVYTQPVTVTQPVYTQPTYTQPVQTAYTYTQPAYTYTGTGYAVMLVDNGSCGNLTAADLISDTCGYTDAEAMQIVANAPTLIAQNLTKDQAAYLAQALTEYGMQVAIYDRYGNQTFTTGLDSVFDGAGSFLTKVAASLGLIGIANRITGAIRKLTLPHKPPVYRLTKPVIQRPPVRRQRIRTVAPRPHQPPVVMQQIQRPSVQNQHPPIQNQHPPIQNQHPPIQNQRPPMQNQRPPMQNQPGPGAPRRDHDPHGNGPEHRKF